MFTNHSLYTIKDTFKMPESCEVCGQKMEIEPGFYYGTGYVSYGLCVGFSIVYFLIYALIFGVSVNDYSLFYFLGSNVALLVILMPLIIRYSRVLYLYMFVKKEKNKEN